MEPRLASYWIFSYLFLLKIDGEKKKQCSTIYMKLCLKKKTGAGEMARLVKVLVTKTGPSLIAGTHRIEEESQLPPRVFQMLV